MLHAILAKHLLHEQFGVGDDLDFGRSFRMRGRQCFEETRILGDVVRGGAEEAGDFDDVAVLGFHEDAVACRTGIAARCAVDVRDDLQDATRSR